MTAAHRTPRRWFRRAADRDSEELLAAVSQLTVDMRNLREDLAEAQRQLAYLARRQSPQQPALRKPQPVLNTDWTSWGVTQDLPKLSATQPIETVRHLSHLDTTGGDAS